MKKQIAFSVTIIIVANGEAQEQSYKAKIVNVSGNTVETLKGSVEAKRGSRKFIKLNN
jgi:hypothetical protein